MDTRDKELIEKIKEENNEAALLELHSKHSKICYQVGIKYKVNLLQESYKLIYDAAKSFNPTKNMKFSTYLWNTSFYHCMSIIKQSNKDQMLKNRAEKNKHLLLPNAPKEDVEELLGCILDDRVKRVVELRINGERSFHRIGKYIGCSGVTAKKFFEKGIQQIKNSLKKD